MSISMEITINLLMQTTTLNQKVTPTKTWQWKGKSQSETMPEREIYSTGVNGDQMTENLLETAGTGLVYPWTKGIAGLLYPWMKEIEGFHSQAGMVYLRMKEIAGLLSWTGLVHPMTNETVGLHFMGMKENDRHPHGMDVTGHHPSLETE